MLRGLFKASVYLNEAVSVESSRLMTRVHLSVFFFFPSFLPHELTQTQHRPAVLHSSDGLNMLLAKIHNTAAALAPQHPSIAVTS